MAFNAAANQLHVSDLDTGLIHRFDANGQDLGPYDHGMQGRSKAGLTALPDDGTAANIGDPSFNAEDASTWGYAPAGRAVWALAVYQGRLDDAVQESVEIWSVKLQQDGSFGDDARLEVSVPAVPGMRITSIAFDDSGAMYLAERGIQQASYDYSAFASSGQSEVLRYRIDPSTGAWRPAPDEYAIGKPAGGRNANGGVAIGLGSEQTGSACSAFVWSTGENLMGGTQYGAPVLHGLQGNSISLVRPADAPSHAYFVDYGAQSSLETDAGHMGDVKVWQSCQGGQSTTSTGGIVTPPDIIVTPDTPTLTIDKQATPPICKPNGAGGWTCTYTITVTNVSSAPWDARVTPAIVRDWLPNPPPGATLTFTGPPGFACVANSPTDVTCIETTDILQPGRSVTLTATVNVPKQAKPICDIENDVQLNDGDPASAWAIIPDKACKPWLKIKKKRNWCHHAHGTRCNFTVAVFGNYPGPVQIDDAIPPGASLPPGSVVSTVPGACNPSGVGLTCIFPGPFPPAATVSFTVVVPDTVAKQHQCKLINTATITTPPGGGSASAAFVIPPKACEQPQLTLQKLFIGCDSGFGTQLCKFTVTVTNAGPGAYNGPLTIVDTPNGGTVTVNGPCGNSLQCNNINIPAGGLVSFTVLVTMSNDTARSLSCKIENTATLQVPPGNSSTAGGLDPSPCKSDLSIKKTSLGCQGQTCKFQIDVTNLGPGVFSGNVSFTDTLPAGVNFVSDTSGWCTASGNCSFPWNAPAASTTVTVNVPLNVAQSPGGCNVENKVQIVSPAAGTDANTSGANDSASAVDVLDQSICAIIRLKCLPPLIGSPPDCHCPSGEIPVEGKCITPIPPVCVPPLVGAWPNCHCPNGEIPVEGKCITPIPPVCMPPLVGTWPNCHCPNNEFFFGGKCIPGCPPPLVGTPPNCLCPNGQPPVNGDCKFCPPPLVGTPPHCLCPNGQLPVNGDCKFCPPPLVGTPPHCLCPNGQPPVNGDCKFCPPPLVGTWPKCLCPNGQPPVNGDCKFCPPPLVGTWPKCLCPNGQPPVNGDCTQPITCKPPLVGTPPDCHCPNNELFFEGKCVRRPTVFCVLPLVGKWPDCHCPNGETLFEGKCIPLLGVCPPPRVGTPPNCHCPNNEAFVDGKCIPQLRGCLPPLVGTPPNCHCPNNELLFEGKCIPRPPIICPPSEYPRRRQVHQTAARDLPGWRDPRGGQVHKTAARDLPAWGVPRGGQVHKTAARDLPAWRDPRRRQVHQTAKRDLPARHDPRRGQVRKTANRDLPARRDPRRGQVH